MLYFIKCVLVLRCYIRGKIGMTFIVDKMREVRLRWFGHIRRRPRDALVRRCETIECPEYRKSRGMPKKELE